MEYPVFVQNLKVKDPQILTDPVSKKYYMYADSFACGTTPTGRKGTGKAIYAICSEDLVNWSDPFIVFEQNDFWANEDYRSLNGFYLNDRYYIIGAFSAVGHLRRIQALVADSPEGPFEPVGDGFLTPPAWQVMDGTLYRDRKGQLWLVFAHDWVEVYDGQICAIRVKEDLSSYIGDPMILFRGSDAPWGDDFMWCSTEGGGCASCPQPYRLKDGSLCMLWTNNTPYGLAIGVAKSETGEICGPWIQVEKPVYALDAGHGTLFNRLEGSLAMVAYQPGGDTGNGEVVPGVTTVIFEMEEVSYGVIEVVTEFTGCWWVGLGGHALAYRTGNAAVDKPTYTALQDYGSPFGRRKIKWGMAPATKYYKGRITEKD